MLGKKRNFLQGGVGKGLILFPRLHWNLLCGQVGFEFKIILLPQPPEYCEITGFITMFGGGSHLILIEDKLVQPNKYSQKTKNRTIIKSRNSTTGYRAKRKEISVTEIAVLPCLLQHYSKWLKLGINCGIQQINGSKWKIQRRKGWEERSYNSVLNRVKMSSFQQHRWTQKACLVTYVRHRNIMFSYVEAERVEFIEVKSLQRLGRQEKKRYRKLENGYCDG